MEERKTMPRHSARKRRRRRNRAGLILKILGTLLVVGVLTLALFVAIFMRYVHTTLEPKLDVDASAYTLKVSSVVYYQDDNGEWVELQKLHGTENRSLVQFSELPPHVWQALVSIEDQRFFEHHGVDWKSTAKAVFLKLTGSDEQRGGSTITQQVIKNLTEDNETTIKRKVTEIFRALRFAQNYSREEVLELYLNKVYFGAGAYGISAAAETYFGKEAKDLSVAEAAAIIGITQYPYKYDPSRGDWYREQNRKRQGDVLYKMRELGYLTEEEYLSALGEELVFVWDEGYVAEEETEESEETQAAEYDSFFVECAIMDVIDDLAEQKGYSREYASDLIYNGGYRIYCTVDPAIQEIVESVYADRNNLNYTSAKGELLQSGMTVVDNATGNIVAVGGRIGERDGAFLWNYAINPRPCGSAIKPLSTYSLGLETGVITAASVMDDYPVRLQENTEGSWKAWPKNSYTGYKGVVTLNYAVRNSANPTAVRILEKIGVSAAYEHLVEHFGITTLTKDDLNSPALALGGLTNGVTTLEMAAAYASFANSGIYTKPRTYVEVRDNYGNLVLENKPASTVALKESTVYTINQLLKEVVTIGTGKEAAFSGMTIAGKTGTTSSNYDRYFVGYTPYYTAAVWVGYDTPTKIVASGNPAALLWNKVMAPVHAGLPNANFPENTADMVDVTVCEHTGLLVGDNCTAAHTVKLPAELVPVYTCDAHVTVDLCSESGLLATDACPASCRVPISVIDLQSPNLQLASGYTRTILTEPMSVEEQKAYDEQEDARLTEYAKRMLEAAENGERIEPYEPAPIPEKEPIFASDTNVILQDYQAKGYCTLHEQQPFYYVPDDLYDPEDYYVPPEEEEENADFLNWLMR